MLPIMEIISKFLMCNLATYQNNNSGPLAKILTLSVTGMDKLGSLIYYFNKYPLGIKGKDFKD